MPSPFSFMCGGGGVELRGQEPREAAGWGLGREGQHMGREGRTQATDSGEHRWTPSIPFAVPHSQVTLLDFGASREFGTEFTDHYIEVSRPQP